MEAALVRWIGTLICAFFTSILGGWSRSLERNRLHWWLLPPWSIFRVEVFAPISIWAESTLLHAQARFGFEEGVLTLKFFFRVSIFTLKLYTKFNYINAEI